MSNLLIKKRSIILTILLSIITCGVYGLFVFFMFGYELKNDAITIADTKLLDPIIAVLLSIITCGIFYLVYIYLQAKALEKIGQNYGVQTNNPILVLVFGLFWLGHFFNYNSGNRIVREESQ